MDKLKEGTPVWYAISRNARLGYYLSESENGMYMVDDPEHGVTRTSDCYAIQISEYSQHVMVPDGWQYLAFKESFIKTVDELAVYIYIKESKYRVMGAPIDKVIYFTYDSKNLIEQALTHCEKLNLLKQLETE